MNISNKQRIKKWRIKNSDKIKEQQKVYELNNKEKLFDYRMDWKLRNRYGITKEIYLDMVKNQKNRCAICGKEESIMQNNKIVKLAIDHNHKENKVRGLLCGSCNRGIGLFQDNIKLLQSAINYLNRNK